MASGERAFSSVVLFAGETTGEVELPLPPFVPPALDVIGLILGKGVLPLAGVVVVPTEEPQLLLF